VDIDKLRQIIEAEVVSALYQEKNALPSISSDKGKITALFTGSSTNRTEAIAQVEKLIHEGYSVDAVLSQAAVKIVNPENIRKIQGIGDIFYEPDFWVSSIEVVKRSKIIIVPILTRNSAAKIALGIADNLVTNIALHALLAGKPVIAARNSADPDHADCICIGTPNTPPALIQIAREYLRKLETYGAKLMDVSDIADYIINEKQTSIQQKLITQDSINNLQPDMKQIKVRKGSIITPLARDAARERGIEILFSDD